VDLQEPPLSDSAYASTLSSNSDRVEVIDNFESKFTLDVVKLTPEYLKAFAKRHEQLYKETPPVLTEGGSQAGFVVSLTVPGREISNLSDTAIWTIQMKRGNEVYRPSVVRRLGDKARWRAFFPGVTLWSHEFLVTFDVPTASAADTPLEKASRSQLVFACADATVTLSL
jgi:hypothetical protein